MREELKKMADQLYQAEKTRMPVPVFSKRADFTLDWARTIAEQNQQRKLSEGHKLRGYKVGITSLEAQKAFGVSEPDYGCLFDSMELPPDGPIDISSLIRPKIEAEIAFILKKDLKGPGIDFEKAKDAIGFACACFEILDCRYDEWKFTHRDLVADNALSSRFVLGRQKVPIESIELPLLGVAFSKNEEVAFSGAGAAVMGNPINALVFLANELGKRGKGLLNGQVILSGAPCEMMWLERGNSYGCEIRNLGKLWVKA